VGSEATTISRLRFSISISLDGFVAGPDQSEENPLGVGGERLHEWVIPLAYFQEMHGREGGEVGESNRILVATHANVGATIMGRNMFGGHPGPWDATAPWEGWWGDEPPFRHPVFVLTHHARAPHVLQNGTSFHFVTAGIEAALAQARQAAGDQDVHLGGGASVARQYFKAGLIDEMVLHLVPTLLGGGERLFEGTGDDLHGLELVRTVSTPRVSHLKFTRRR
jgi:dihydrofolate reductase